MDTKEIWFNKYEKTHYFKKNIKTKFWEEIRGKKIENTFRFQTYDSRSVILVGVDSNECVELSEENAKRVYNNDIDSLDTPDDIIDGFWQFFNSKTIERK